MHIFVIPVAFSPRENEPEGRSFEERPSGDRFNAIVIPAKAGIHFAIVEKDQWIPAFAGMTILGSTLHLRVRVANHCRAPDANRPAPPCGRSSRSRG